MELLKIGSWGVLRRIRWPRPFPIRFDRNEWSGAFGDSGTDIPLLVGMILQAKLDVTNVFVVFGFWQIVTGLIYRVPMPVQPLKAMAALVIAGGISPEVLRGGGFAIGALMLLIVATGALEFVGRVVPLPVVRGIQLGLALQLSIVALTKYVPSEGVPGYALAAASLAITLALYGNRKFPPSLLLILLGLVYALAVGKFDSHALQPSFETPTPTTISPSDVASGLLLLALPQLPLSLANSVLATKQLASDLFPQRKITLTKIGITYSVMNLLNPFVGGVPTCHGSGGMAGHYSFGGRTGGSVVLYGAFFVLLGLFFSSTFSTILSVFPLPLLGVVLFFEALALLRVVQGALSTLNAPLVWIVGLSSALLPYGFVVGLLLGIALSRSRLFPETPKRF